MSGTILHITLRSDIGGGPEHVYRLSTKLKETHNCNQHIAAPKQEPYYDLFKEVTGGRLFELPCRKFRFKFFFALLAYVNNNNIEVIHSHGKGAGVYSRLMKIAKPRIKVVHTFHGWHVGKYSSLTTSIYNIYESLLSLITRKLICVSASEYTGLPQVMKHIAKPKFTIIPNGVEIPEAIPPLTERTIDVVIVTRFDYQKNFEFALDVIEKMPQTNFTIVGPIDEAGQKHIEYCSKRAMKNARFIGASQDVRQYLMTSKVILSTSRWEGLSLAILEAMSEGCVPILSRVTGNADIQIPKSLFYESGDLLGAVNAISSVLEDEQRWKDLSVASSELAADNYSISAMAKRVADIYSNC